MNPLRKETSNKFGQGFVYFNTNKALLKQTSADTTDFLSFSSESSPGTSPQNGNFRPSNFSSPSNKPYYGKAPRNRAGRNQYYNPHNNRAKSWRQTAGLSRPNTNEQDNSHQYRHQNRHHKNYSKDYSNPQLNKNCSAFYDPTCLLNPWQELEEKIAQESQHKTSLNSNISGQTSDENTTNRSSSNSSEDKSDDSDSGSYEAEESLS
ncbi:uncharacterized protein LOC143199542 [Rhynchophorus ferrugineus]|uniref:uncharacterized protein LOC143199542 n=1 Tax=Rhynchophorus ferrugineus TaxID=354439 RepID=UPI003FCD8713